MYLDYTEAELTKKFMAMMSHEIVSYLMEEGLTLKVKKNFNDLPGGIYRRQGGRDLIRFSEYSGFNRVDTHGNNARDIVWVLEGDLNSWWDHVLDISHKPVIYGLQFQVDIEGNRLA